jgi:Flp pilus assembly protein TadD
MKRLNIVAAALACLPLLLGGCSTLRNTTRPSVANNELPEAGTLNPKRSQSLFLAIINGLRDEGQSRAALAYLDEFDKQYPGVPYAALLRAECLMDVGQLPRAEPVFTLLLGGEYSGAAYAGLGSIAAAREDWKDAAKDFQEALRVEPSRAQYASDLGFAQVRLGDYAAGVEMLGRASELAPRNDFIRNNLILGLHLAGQDGQAARVIDAIDNPNERQSANKLLLVSAQSLAAQTALRRAPDVPGPPNPVSNEVKS